MEITVNREDLTWLVQTSGRPIPTRSTLPNIKGCLIEASGDRVTFSGTNLDWGVKVSAPARIDSPGSVVISAKLLEDVVKTISTPEVSLRLDESAWALTIESGTSEVVLNALPADDFPRWPEPDISDAITIEPDLFADLVKTGAACAVTNPARPLWGAALVEVKDGKLVVVSTDQFALSRARISVAGREGKAILPANVLQDMARLCSSGDSGNIQLSFSSNYLYMSSGTVSCFSRLIEGQYYAYEQVLPRTFVSTAKVPTDDLLRAAERASIVASEEDRAMRMILDTRSGTLTVKAGSAEKGKMEEKMPAEITGESIEVWVQHKYITQALNKISTSKTFLGMTGQVSPMKLEPVPEADASVDVTFVVMPMSPKGAF